MLTDFTSYQDGQREFSRERLWELFDGNAQQLNITHECIDRHVGREVTITVMRRDGSDERLTAVQIADASSRFAAVLAHRGVGHGERVGIMLEPGFAFYACLFGAMKAGAIAVPLYTLFGRDGLALRIDDCKPQLLVIAPQCRALADNLRGIDVIVADDGFAELLAQQPPAPAPDTAADDMAMYQYTSGTTRELPEAVKHRHRAIVTVMIAALYATGLRPGDRFCCPSSPSWGHGLWHGTLAPLALGVSIWSWAGPFDAAALLAGLARHRITNLSAAATHYRLMKNSGTADTHHYDVQKLTYTGEAIDSTTEEFCRTTFGRPVRSIYGTTEVGVILANYPGADDIPVKPRSLGRPMPGLQIEIHDPDGQPCRPGQVGEIVVAFRADTWIRTKDLGWIDADGIFFHGGRADDVIISAGWTMSAREIEDTLMKHPDIREAAAIGIPDALRGQIVKAFIISDRAADEAFVREVQDFVRDRLSQHEYPRAVEVVCDLPRTTSGKVNRKVLREKAKEGRGALPP